MDVILPKWGMTMQEGTVARWHKEVGDSVVKGEAVLDIETDKVEVALEAPIAGVITSRNVPEGATVPVGTVVCVID